MWYAVRAFAYRVRQPKEFDRDARTAFSTIQVRLPTRPVRVVDRKGSLDSAIEYIEAACRDDMGDQPRVDLVRHQRSEEKTLMTSGPEGKSTGSYYGEYCRDHPSRIDSHLIKGYKKGKPWRPGPASQAERV